jgi:hypothetical protein
MTIVLLAALLVVGCSTTNDFTGGSYGKLPMIPNESEQILERERQCTDAALLRSDDQLSRIGVTDDSSEQTALTAQTVANDRDRQLSECKANAEREEEQLSAHERAEYTNRAKDELERESLMTILTTSLPR